MMVVTGGVTFFLPVKYFLPQGQHILDLIRLSVIHHATAKLDTSATTPLGFREDAQRIQESTLYAAMAEAQYSYPSSPTTIV